MKLIPAAPPFRLAALTLALATTLTACSTIGDLFSGDKSDYQSTAARTKPLDVPPDLTQLARDSRYQPQGGVVSAAASDALAAAAPNPATAPAAAATGVALNRLDGMRIERAGQQRWLVVPRSPEQIWPQVKAYWEQRGFVLESADAKTGVMKTNWAENRAQLSADTVRSTIGRIFGNLHDTGVRDQFSTRIERVEGGSEIYVSYRGVEEVYTDERRENTTWRARPSDPQLEAEQLSRLMIALGGGQPPAQAAPAAAQASASAPQAPGKSPPVASAGATSLVVEEPFDRAWRRVGLALDHGGFTVEDRDRAAGLYYVRYVDPKSVGKDEPGLWAKLWGNTANPQAAQRLRIFVKPTGQTTTVSVQSSTGVAETGENAQRIVALLVKELH